MRFISNLREVLARAKQGEPIEVVGEADEVCSWCPHLIGGACSYKEGAEAEIARLDQTAVHLLGLQVHNVVTWKGVREKLPIIFDRWRRFICSGCDWRSVCQEANLWRELVEGEVKGENEA